MQDNGVLDHPVGRPLAKGDRLVDLALARVEVVELVGHRLDVLTIEGVENVLVRQEQDVVADIVEDGGRLDPLTDGVEVHQENPGVVVAIGVKVLQADLVDHFGGVGQSGVDSRGVKVVGQVGRVQPGQVVDAEHVGVQVEDLVEVGRQEHVGQEPVVDRCRVAVGDRGILEHPVLDQHRVVGHP